MQLITERGTFQSFQHLRSAYLKSKDGAEYWLDPGPFGQDDWDKSVLHASDVGSCPRQVAYRLLGTKEKPRSIASEANRNIMFSQAYRMHFLQYSALNWADILVSYEHPVSLPLGWTGHLDALFLADYRLPDITLYDMKSVLPNALKYSYSLPKPKDALQLGVYGTDVAVRKDRPILSAVVEYADRAGSNTPFIAEVDIGEWVTKATARMRALEQVRDALPDLPSCLPARYVGHYSKQRGKPWTELSSLTYEAAWECGYCEFHLSKKVGRFGVTQPDSNCKPYNKPPITVAEFKHGSLVKVTSGHEAGVEKWLAENRVKYALEVEDE